MAHKVLVQMVDDIDGGVAHQTVPFGLDGVQYEIDLSDENAESLREEFARYIAASRRTGGRKARRGTASTTPTPADRERSREIRAWAAENGWSISERGRIPTDVITAFEDSRSAGTKPRSRGGRKKATAKA
ncbi:Lsr2 family protein [Amycolatopsis sp. FDAARGOS 1241]|uniref:histone-like nucleoid-structuring protein Lsr2 n=1 Tax=Amycolatopsis sp. FDAARGOS 1241 TaxID=2778070 RepID=UPI00194F7B8E|nr:Lsr2 family protein [Amycolatopsis sp. FDAARGOS 1241]QRP43279.1 Lsr2 family protein [Amycolatopsis sp. FDAARGOS 1241]